MPTAKELIEELGTCLPSLETVANRFLGIDDKAAAYRQFHKGELGFPCFKLSKSNKAPLFVRVEDLADYINQQALIASEK